jgi:redox-sensitive bicupin YhaK (pirin superfamily)
VLFLSSLLPTTESMKAAGNSMKGIKVILPRPRSHWVGDGFHVYPVFADKAFTNELSPFLMFDYGAPKQFPANNPKKLGVGQHPHRGFETITVAFQGEVEHADSMGNRGVIGEGDVQWMTAGRGIVHEEFHSQKFAKAGGAFEMCQLWLNLPKEHKMTPPRYQPILKNEITTSPLYLHAADACGAPADPAEGGVRVIAGSFMGVKGPASTFTQVRVCV